MKRRTLRRTELSRTTRLIRARRPDPENRGRLAATKRRETGPSKAVRALVEQRDGMRCVICRYPCPPGSDRSIHHRANRGMGGSRRPGINGPANLLLLCGSGSTGCHGMVTTHPIKADQYGWTISASAFPSAAPLLWHGRWVLLTDSGDIEELP